jgi:hypothetical protein
MRLCCGLMEGQMWDAVLQPSPKASSETQPLIVLSNDEVLSPADADFGEFTIVEATAEERETLKQAGYSMPDWTPLQGLSCAAGPTDQVEDEDEPKGSTEQPQP